MKNIFSTRAGIIVVGAVIGIGAALLQYFGNPPNMGICVACFERDIAGALGFHRADVVQYLRPEIMGFVLGAFVAALIAGEYKPRGGSSPLIRFFLGIFAMMGALVFLGCPWRTLLRLAGGDGNAILGIAGLIVGIFIGVLFLKNGYSLGRSHVQRKASGWVFPALMIGLFLLLVFQVSFTPGGPIFFSAKGPGSQHAPILFKDFHLISGVAALLVFAFVTNMVLGQFKPGFEGQPVAHTQHIWNFLGMALSGLAFVLAGGCPGRQLFLSGEGDMDAAIFAIGMIVGAGIAHNFAMASSPKGIGAFGPAAVIVGFLFCLIIGLTQRDKISA